VYVEKLLFHYVRTHINDVIISAIKLVRPTSLSVYAWKIVRGFRFDLDQEGE